MFLQAEFEANFHDLEVSQDALLMAGKELMNSQKLQDLFYIVLLAGNFLNSVTNFKSIFAFHFLLTILYCTGMQMKTASFVLSHCKTAF